MTDDLISRQAVLEINEKYWIRGFNLGYADKVKYEVEALPFVDAVEVVRCKDCIYHREAHYESDAVMNLIMLILNARNVQRVNGVKDGKG